MFPIWFLNPFEYLPVQFSSCLLAGNTPIHVACYLFSTSRAGLICFCVFKSGIFVFLEILSFGFYLVNSECGAYLTVDLGLVYGSYSKMFLLFLSLILNLIPVLKPSFSVYILVLFPFCFVLLDLLEFCHQLSPACRPCLSIFYSQWNEATQFKPRVHHYLNLPIATNSCVYRAIVISCCAHMFSYCFYPWPYMLNVSLFSSSYVNLFSIAVHVFHNLFWKICPLFGKILITCSKCSGAFLYLYLPGEEIVIALDAQKPQYWW